MRCRQWFVVIASCLVSFINIGFMISIGALFHPISEKFKTNKPATALVHSFSFGSMVIGVVVGSLVDKYGLFKVSLSGTVATIVGLGGGYFASSIIHLYIVSLVSGIGMALIGMCTLVGIENVTKGKTKSIALATNNSWIALGALAYPHFLAYLVASYGLNGTYLILAGVFCNNFILVVATQDLGSAIRVTHTSDVDSSSLDTADTDYANYNKHVEHKTYKRVTFIDNIMPTFLRITSISYVLTWILSTANLSATDGYLAICVDIYTSMGYTEQQGITSMVFYQVGTLTAGPLSVILKQIKSVSTFAVPCVFSICGSVGIILTYFASKVQVAYTGACLIGLADGTYIGVLFILAEIVPTDLYGTSFGIIITSVALTSFAAGPINGALRDATGSYAVPCLVIWITLFLTAILFVITGLVQRKSNLRAQSAATENLHRNYKGCS